MKVTCQSCQAKYSIADEKVRGKIAKIRCKKCGTTIVVNGTAIDANSPDVSMPPESYAEPTDRAGADEAWTVLIDDGDQRTLTVAQISELFADGTVTLDTHVWKDGMDDWLPIQHVEALRSLLEEAGQPPAAAPALANTGAAGAAATHDSGRGVTRTKSGAPAQAGRGGPAVAETAYAHASQPAARTEPRKPGRGGTTDLFGVSGGDDLLQSGGGPSGGAVHDRPTGARNENSVLFSLSALTGTQPTADDRSKSAGGSSSGNGIAGSSKNKLDDILNLGGGGIYAPSLAAPPVLAPPPVDEPAPAMDPVMVGTKPAKSKGLVFGVVGAMLGAGIAVAALMSYMGTSKPDETASGTGTSATTSTSSSPNAASTGAPAGSQARTGSGSEPSAAPSENAAASAAAPAATPTALVPGAVPATAKPAEQEKPSRPVAVAPKTGGGSAAAEAPKPTGVSAIGAAIAQEKPTPPPAAAPAAAAAPGASFDRAAAISTLGSIATAVQVCKRPDGPTGQGRVAITFANSGNATTANIEGPPFAGTPVGGCVAARFRTARVPAFSGDPVTVHKSFQIN